MMTTYTVESACEVIVVHALSVELSAGPDVDQFLSKIPLNNFDTKFNVNVMQMFICYSPISNFLYSALVCHITKIEISLVMS